VRVVDARFHALKDIGVEVVMVDAGDLRPEPLPEVIAFAMRRFRYTKLPRAEQQLGAQRRRADYLAASPLVVRAGEGLHEGKRVGTFASRCARPGGRCVITSPWLSRKVHRRTISSPMLGRSSRVTEREILASWAIGNTRCSHSDGRPDSEKIDLPRSRCTEPAHNANR
jgi:hypothetical protein